MTTFHASEPIRLLAQQGGTTKSYVSSGTTPTVECDVFIAGSGPIGATYARLLVKANLNVFMVEIGEQESAIRGVHKKNTVDYQKDIDKFVNVIKGALSTVSIPVSQTDVSTLDPMIWRADRPFVRNGMNPEQNAFRNLPAQAVTRTVGGMSTHWTCLTPRFHPMELPKIDLDETKNAAIWDELYESAEKLIGTGTGQFSHSIRHQIVLETLQKAYKDAGRKFQDLPLACDRVSSTFVNWHSACTIFDLEDKTDSNGNALFCFRANTQCVQLVKDSSNTITTATVIDLSNGGSKRYQVKAKYFILAMGVISNPQILVNSGFAPKGPPTSDSQGVLPPGIPNLGQYLSEQTMAFFQVAMSKTLVDWVKSDMTITGTPGQRGYKVSYVKGGAGNQHSDEWDEKVCNHMNKHQLDPLPIPFTEPEPQVTTLFSQDHPWHTQIHRDAFSYGEVAENIDSRLIVDFRWFGRTHPIRENLVYYSAKYIDKYGMPQPTFDYSIPPPKSAQEIAANTADIDSSLEAHEMMADMVDVASKIGGFLPGSEPQFMQPGLALHLAGSHRSGRADEQGQTVVDTNSLVWNFGNLYLGGVGNIPTAFACNPTLTAIAYAIRSARSIIASNTKQSGDSTPATNTSDSEGNYLLDRENSTTLWETVSIFQGISSGEEYCTGLNYSTTLNL